jgi:hypothetical protein
MSKMAKRRRKAKKNRKTMAKLMESLKNIKVRVPVPPVGTSFASIKDYDRRNNKKAVEEGLDE